MLRKQNEEDMKHKDDSDSEDEEGMKDGSDSEDDEEADKKKGIKAMDTMNSKEKNAAFSVPMQASDLDLSKLSYE